MSVPGSIEQGASHLHPGPNAIALVASVEDTVLAKLKWYKSGGEVSERQWRDALGVLQVQGGRLDLNHVRHVAAGLGVQDLLERAIRDLG
jgi:hypothetical protein